MEWELYTHVIVIVLRKSILFNDNDFRKVCNYVHVHIIAHFNQNGLIFFRDQDRKVHVCIDFCKSVHHHCQGAMYQETRIGIFMIENSFILYY